MVGRLRRLFGESRTSNWVRPSHYSPKSQSKDPGSSQFQAQSWEPQLRSDPRKSNQGKTKEGKVRYDPQVPAPVKKSCLPGFVEAEDEKLRELRIATDEAAGEACTPGWSSKLYRLLITPSPHTLNPSAKPSTFMRRH